MSWTTATLLFFANYSFRSSWSVPAHHSIILFTHFLLAFISAFTSYFIPRYFPSSFSTSTLSLLLHSNPFFHLAPFILSPSCPKEILIYSLLQIHISILFQGIKKYIHFVSFNFCSPTSSNIFLSLHFLFFFTSQFRFPFHMPFIFPFFPLPPHHASSWWAHSILTYFLLPSYVPSLLSLIFSQYLIWPCAVGDTGSLCRKDDCFGQRKLSCCFINSILQKLGQCIKC